MNRAKPRHRCEWAGSDARMIAYHDRDWGKPVRRDRKWFEFLVLEGAQAGLSWSTILNKRDNYRNAFDHFDPEKVARYNRRKIESLLKDPGIVRNRLKVESAVSNAQAFLQVREKHGTFNRYIWRFVDGVPIQNRWRGLAELPATTKESDAMSRDLKQRGFRFVGSTICYAFMQATGMVNDHEVSCFRHEELKR